MIKVAWGMHATLNDKKVYLCDQAVHISYHLSWLEPGKQGDGQSAEKLGKRGQSERQPHVSTYKARLPVSERTSLRSSGSKTKK